MIGLIIDTSRDEGILGLTENGKLISFELIKGGQFLSTSLFPNLEKFCDMQKIHFISIGIGPGSYMGIRASATIGQTLSFALNIPLVDFPSPLAFIPEGHEGTFAFLGDAKMGQYYLISGTIKDQEVYDFTPFQLIGPEDIPSFTTQVDFVIGEDFIPPKAYLGWVAKFSYQNFIKRNFLESSSIALNYLR